MRRGFVHLLAILIILGLIVVVGLVFFASGGLQKNIKNVITGRKSLPLVAFPKPFESGYFTALDSPEVVEKKIKKYAFSGGQATLEEHRKKGGNPDVDVSYQWLRMLFEPDDKKLKKIYDDYRSGKLLTGELKQILIEKINSFLKEHQKKREQAKKQLDKFLLKD